MCLNLGLGLGIWCGSHRGVGRAELGGGGSKQLKLPPGGGFGKGCKISYIFFRGGGGGGVRATGTVITEIIITNTNSWRGTRCGVIGTGSRVNYQA